MNAFRFPVASRVVLTLGVGLFAAFAISVACHGQELPELTEDEKSAIEKIVEPVRMCNQLCGHSDDIRGDVHTPLFHHVSDRPSVDSLFQQLTSAFLTHAKAE